jgi:hypothetical protein
VDRRYRRRRRCHGSFVRRRLINDWRLGNNRWDRNFRGGLFGFVRLAGSRLLVAFDFLLRPDASALGLDGYLNMRRGLNCRSASVATSAGAEPFAHRLRQSKTQHAHVIWDFVAQTLIAALCQDCFALYTQLFSKLVDSDAFSQNALRKN